MMLLYSLIAVYANQRMPYKLLSTWVCIMLTVRMVMSGWTIYACLILAGLMLVVPWPKRDIFRDTREWYVNY